MVWFHFVDICIIFICIFDSFHIKIRLFFCGDFQKNVFILWYQMQRIGRNFYKQDLHQKFDFFSVNLAEEVTTTISISHAKDINPSFWTHGSDFWGKVEPESCQKRWNRSEGLISLTWLNKTDQFCRTHLPDSEPAVSTDDLTYVMREKCESSAREAVYPKWPNFVMYKFPKSIGRFSQ